MQQGRHKHLSKELFRRQFTKGDALFKTGPRGSERLDEVFALVNGYAQDPAKGLREDELDDVPLRIWCVAAAEGDAEGPLPCDEGQQYEHCSEEEAKKIEEYLQGALAKSAAAKAAKGAPK